MGGGDGGRGIGATDGTFDVGFAVVIGALVVGADDIGFAVVGVLVVNADDVGGGVVNNLGASDDGALDVGLAVGALDVGGGDFLASEGISVGLFDCGMSVGIPCACEFEGGETI